MKLSNAIDDFKNSFWDIDEIHSFEIRLDAFCSILAQSLEEQRHGSTDNVYGYVPLFKQADIGENAVNALSKLLAIVESTDYGESMLDQDGLDSANSFLETLHKGLNTWFDKQLKSR